MSVIVTQQRARKQYICTTCQLSIEPGQVYDRHALTPNDSQIGNPRWWVLRSDLSDGCPRPKGAAS